jgi:hypothetical protein
MSEVSLYGQCPRERLGTCSSLLPQNRKDGCRCLPERTRSEQPKAPNGMLIGVRNVLDPPVNELFRRTLDVNPATHHFVFVPKPDDSLPDPCDTTLRNGRSPYVATGVLQKTLFVLKRLNLGAPPTFLEMGEHVFHLLSG